MSAMIAAFFAATLVQTPPAPGNIDIWSAPTLVWQENRPGGAQRSILEGDVGKAGVVTYAFHIPDGAWFPPHSHATSARVFVLKGMLLLGEGRVADPVHVRRIPAGEVALVPAGLVHYEGAEGDTVIIGVAEGPWTTRFVPLSGDQPAAEAPVSAARRNSTRAAP